MFHNVLIESSEHHKSFTAFTALKILCNLVILHVYLEVIFSEKHCATLAALILFYSSVCVCVTVQITLMGKLLTTFLTRKVLFLGVQDHVTLEVVFLVEGFAAHIALVVAAVDMSFMLSLLQQGMQEVHSTHQ